MRHSSNLRVLIVDDEHVIADTLALILRQYGFDVMAAYSGETAVETAKMQEPDIMISDVIMGSMNGIEAAIRVSAHLPRCRIILHSGQATTADLLSRAETAGHFFEVYSKPVHPKKLLKLLNVPVDC